MKRFLFILCVAISFTGSNLGCAKPAIPKAPQLVYNIDSLFIAEQLPRIRDAFCADTITLKYLRSIFKGTFYAFKFGIVVFLDSSESCSTFYHTRASITIDSTNRIRRIDVKFPDTFNVTNDKMIEIFGRYNEHHTRMKNGSRGEYDFVGNCRPKIEVSAYLNSDSKVGTIYMWKATHENSEGYFVDSEGKRTWP